MAETRRLCFLRGSLLHNIIGATDRVIANHFVGLDWDVHLITISFDCAEPATRAPTLRAGVNTWAAWTMGIPIVQGLLASLTSLKILLEINPDVIVVNDGLGLAASLYKLLRPRTRIVMDVRSIPVSSSPLYIQFSNLMLRASLTFTPYDALSIITSGMLEDLRKEFGFNKNVPVAVWGSGVDEVLFDPSKHDRDAARAQLGVQPDETLLVYHGSIAIGRNLEVLPGVLEHLRRLDSRKYKLLIFGDGPQWPAIRAEANRLDVTDLLITPATVPLEAVPGLLVAADAGIIPLPRHPWWEHQAPMKLYEYLAMRLPMVAVNLTAHQGISSAIQLTEGSDAQSLAQGVLELLPRINASLRDQARRDAMRYTWAGQAQKLAPLLEATKEPA